MQNIYHIIVIGGGAAGFFGSIQCAKNPKTRVTLLEKSHQLLTKVRISGGGRCNVTHACYNPKQLVLNYPRGEQELLGPFTRFQPKDMILWFEELGVELKTEGDGRIFPVSNTSETIVDCFLKEATKHHVVIKTKAYVKSIVPTKEGFSLHLIKRPYTAIKYCLQREVRPKDMLLQRNWDIRSFHLYPLFLPSIFLLLHFLSSQVSVCQK